MISRFEFLYIKDKIKKIEDHLFQYEHIDPMHKEWIKLTTMPMEEYKALQEAWDQYYEKCRQTPAYSRYKECQAAFKSGNMARVRELAQEARDARTGGTEFLKPPSLVDPTMIQQQMSRYFTLKSSLVGLKNTYEEYRNVYEKKSELDIL